MSRKDHIDIDPRRVPPFDPIATAAGLSPKSQEDLGYGRGEPTPEEAKRMQELMGGRAIYSTAESRKAPTDDEGYYLIDEIQPGDFLPDWGPVKGKKLDSPPEISFVEATAEFVERYGRGVAKLYAARRYALLANNLKNEKRKDQPAKDKLISLHEKMTGLKNEFRAS